MYEKILLLLSFCCAVTSGWAAEILSPAEEAAKRWKQYQPAFDAFAEQDRVTPFAPGGIVFVGSSIFRQWTTVPEQMAPLPVLNRAFGGSRTGDQLARFDQVVTPYAPKVIVYYCGSNDLKAGAVAEDPAAIFARFRAFSERVQATLPQTRIILSPARGRRIGWAVGSRSIITTRWPVRIAPRRRIVFLSISTRRWSMRPAIRGSISTKRTNCIFIRRPTSSLPG